MQGSTEKDPSNPRPDLLLLVQSFRIAQTLDVAAEAEEPE